MSAQGTPVVLEDAAIDRLRRIGGQEFVVEMIDLFLENAPQRVEAAREALAAEDSKSLYRAAHSLKSTAGNLGARALQAAAERLEAKATGTERAVLPELLEEMDRRYQEARTALSAERDRMSGI